MDHYEFDSILFPVNYVTWYQGHFGPAVLEKAHSKDMGILALKALAKKPWPDGKKEKWTKAWYSPVDTYEEARTALSWTLSRARHRLREPKSRGVLVVDDRCREGTSSAYAGRGGGHCRLHAKHRAHLRRTMMGASSTASAQPSVPTPNFAT